MEKNSILEFNNKESVSDVLNELLRDGAQQLIHQAVETELSEYFSQHQRIADDGRLALVRNGYLPKRNYSGTPIFWYNTDFIGLILKTEKFEYLILKFKNQ